MYDNHRLDACLNSAYMRWFVSACVRAQVWVHDAKKSIEEVTTRDTSFKF